MNRSTCRTSPRDLRRIYKNGNYLFILSFLPLPYLSIRYVSFEIQSMFGPLHYDFISQGLPAEM